MLGDYSCAGCFTIKDKNRFYVMIMFMKIFRKSKCAAAAAVAPKEGKKFASYMAPELGWRRKNRWKKTTQNSSIQVVKGGRAEHRVRL
jgi:hypothetical protein